MFSLPIIHIVGQIENQQDTIPKTSNGTVVDSVSLNKKAKSDITSPINYSAKDSLMFSVKKKIIYAYGDAKLGMEEMQLDAGQIKMNIDSNYLYAKALKGLDGKLAGDPVFKDGSDEYKIKTIKYNFKTKKGLVTDVVTEQGGGFLHAKITKMQPNKEFHISDGMFSTCDAEHPHFFVQLTRAKIIPEKKIISGPFYFVIADIPIYFAGLPFGYFPVRKNRTSGIILPQFTEEKRRGFGLEGGGFYWAASDYMDMTMRGEIWSGGSWGIDVSSNYKKRYKYSGSYNFSYKKLVEADVGASSSFWVRLNYNRDQKASPSSTFSASLNFGSSKFRSYESYDINVNSNNNTSSSIAYTKTFPRFSFSANMSGTQNLSTHMVSLQLPTLTFNMTQRLFPFKKKISTGKKSWYEEISLGFSSSMQNSISSIADSLLFTHEAVRKMSNGYKYTIPVSTSFKILKYLNLSPSFSYNGRVYTNYLKQNYYDERVINGKTVEAGFYADTISGLRHVYDFAFSAPLSTKLYGTVQFKKGKIAAIRHVMSPSVGFSYRPDFGQENWGYYKIDQNDTTGNDLFSIYGNGVYGTAPSGKSGSISFGLDNNLEMKLHSNDTTEKFKKVMLLQSLRFSTGYNMAVKSLNWSDIAISANTRLLKQISVTYSSNVNLYKLDSLGQKINRLIIKDGKKIGNFTRHTISMSGSISSDTFKKKKDGNKRQGQQEGGSDTDGTEIPSSLEGDMDKGVQDMEEKEKVDEDKYSFSIPWSLTVNYSFSNISTFNKTLKRIEKKNTQTVNLSGNLKLTSKWSVSGSLNYDIEAKKLVQTQCSIDRDLHCWQMGFNFVPFGTYQSYSFRINVKSSLFKGLEYKKQSSWRDNLSF